MNKISVAVVDDNEADRYIAKRVLSKFGVVSIIEEFCGGEDVLEVIRQPSKFDAKFGPHPPRTLILLDINMPRMNGFELLKSISELRQEGKIETDNSCIVMMLTSSDYSGDREQSMQYDFVSDYIEKPINKEKFMAILKRHYPECVSV